MREGKVRMRPARTWRIFLLVVALQASGALFSGARAVKREFMHHEARDNVHVQRLLDPLEKLSGL